MAERSEIRHKVSFLWGLIPIKNERLDVGYNDGPEHTWREDQGDGTVEGRSWFYKVEVTSPDTVIVHDWQNVYLGRSDAHLKGKEINEYSVSTPTSCWSHAVGYSDRYIYQASGK